MKKLLFLFIVLSGFLTSYAQTEGTYICRLKKDYRATNLHRQTENTLLKAGEQYPVLGTSGKMIVIKVGSKPYFVSTGSVELFSVTERKGGKMKNDTITTPIDSLQKYIQ